MTADGTVKIADFGIAKALDRLSSGQNLTITGTTVGTPAYMAPEQAMGHRVGPWTDLYSVGVIAYEMLVGRVPFEGTDTPMALLLRHVNEPVPPPLVVNRDLDPGLSEWIEALLVKDPARRTQSAADAWDALEETAIAVLGPLWRREGRLVERAAPAASRPLAPAPFPKDDEGDRDHTRDADAALGDTLEPSGPPSRDRATRAAPKPSTARTGSRDPASASSVDVSPRLEPARGGTADLRLAAAAVAAAAALAGFAASRAGDGEPAPAAANTASNAAAKVSYSSYWRPAGRPRVPVPGLRVSDPIVLARAAAGSREELTVGRTAATGPHLLPGAFLERLPSPPGRDDRVRLGRLAAQRYAGLRPRGLRTPVTVYAVPTSRGVTTVTCVGAGRELSEECASVAGSLELLSGRPFGLDPEPRYVRAVAGSMEALNRTRAAARERMRRARIAPTQYRAAVELARANARARRVLLSQGTVTPAVRPAHTALVRALGATAAAYERMAAATARGDRAGFDRSALAIERGERAIDGALEGFEDLGWVIT